MWLWAFWSSGRDPQPPHPPTHPIPRQTRNATHLLDLAERLAVDPQRQQREAPRPRQPQHGAVALDGDGPAAVPLAGLRQGFLGRVLVRNRFGEVRVQRGLELLLHLLHSINWCVMGRDRGLSAFGVSELLER